MHYLKMEIMSKSGKVDVHKEVGIVPYTVRG